MPTIRDVFFLVARKLPGSYMSTNPPIFDVMPTFPQITDTQDSAAASINPSKYFTALVYRTVNVDGVIDSSAALP
jgi:hypothetical protein